MKPTVPAPVDPAPVDPALGELLDRVVADEPPAHVTVDEVYGHAYRLRRSRLRTALAAGICLIVLVALAGYGITRMWSAGHGPLSARERPVPARPSSGPQVSSGAAPAGGPATVTSTVSSAVSMAADPVLSVAASAAAARGRRIIPAGAWHGVGWRRYTVRDDAGRARGTVEVTVYTAPGGLCFPTTPPRPGSCAEAVSSGGVDYVRYADVETAADPDADAGGAGGDAGDPGRWGGGSDRDGSRRANQVIARRSSDGWAVAVVAAGPRDRGAPLSMDDVVRMATDPRLPDAFGPDEWCGRPDPRCPAPPVPLPTDD